MFETVQHSADRILGRSPTRGKRDRAGNGAGGLRMEFAWDAENRLILVEPTEGTDLPAEAERVELAYDYLGRRIEKKVYNWDRTDPNDPNSRFWEETPALGRRFVWSGWLMLLELEPRWARHLAADPDAETVRQLRRHEATGRPAGDERFVRRLERLLDRVLRPQKPGRPKKESEK